SPTPQTVRPCRRLPLQVLQSTPSDGPSLRAKVRRACRLRGTSAQTSASQSPRCLVGGDSALRLGVRPCGRTVELESNERLITGDPRVMPRFDQIRIAFGNVLFGSVVVGDVH